MQNWLQQVIDRASGSDEILAVLLAACLSAIGWVVVRVVTGRPKVRWAFSHRHAFYLQNLNPAVLAYTKEIWVQNTGRAVAEGVEIVLATTPQHFDVWPQRHYTALPNPGGSLTIKFDNLNRKEFVTISMFQTAVAPPDVTNVRWHGGVGKQLPMGPQQIYPRWFIAVLRGFLMFGFFSFWYFVFRLIWHG